MFKFIIYLCLVLMLINQVRSLDDIKQTDYACKNEYVNLECQDGHIIIITKSLYKYSPSQCVDTESIDSNSKGSDPLDECIGVSKNDPTINELCNGLINCSIPILKKTHSLGYYGTTCDFESNMGSFFYKCVPKTISSKYKAFDICENNGPDTILGIEKGYIHSPSYPYYYGNNRKCIINIEVPKGKRLTVYLLTKSLEGLSFVKQAPNDFLSIDNAYEHNGISYMPQVIYSGADREKVQLKFISDWITTVQLPSPKGFLVYFELTSANDNIETKTSTVTSTLLITEQGSRFSINETESSVMFDSQKIKKDFEVKDENEVLTIIAVLVALIGVLVLVIFGLLFLFRRRNANQQQNEEIYDAKSIVSANYTDTDYHNSSILSTASHSKLSKQQQQQSKCQSEPTSKFNNRLRDLYNSLNKSLNLSAQIINSNQKIDKEFVDINSNEKLNFKNDQTQLKNINENIFKINEFNPNDVDVKYEKDIPIDRLKLFKSSPARSLKSISNLYKSNIGIEQQEKNASCRLENTYVSNPIAENKESQSDKMNNLSAGENETQKLQIYEVNFDNNFAYIMPKSQLSKSNTQSESNNGLKPEENKLNEPKKDEIEIYQSINELEDEQDFNFYNRKNEENKTNLNETCQSLNDTIDSSRAMLVKKSNKDNEANANDLNIYATPSNKRFLNTDSNSPNNSYEEGNQNQNSSVIHLLDNNDNETNA